MWGKYTILNFHWVNDTGGMWVLHLQQHRFQGVQLGYFQSQTSVLCGIGQIIGGGGVVGRVYLG